jgi:hypothetical protein
MAQATRNRGRADAQAEDLPTSARAEGSAIFEATAFGLDVRSETVLSLLQGSSAAATGRGLEISEQTDELVWPEQADLICNQLDMDGNVLFRIEAHPQAGYLVSGPKHGAHLLSPDGRRLRCAPLGSPAHAWQRLLISQVLPFAALLHGLEVFHASAVARHGQALAILGTSGAGKTSVTLELCRLGADFLADDVVALEIGDGALLAHPGTQMAGLDHAEARRLQSAGTPRREPVLAVNERERLLRMNGATEPVPLAAMFFLDRRPDGPASPHFEPIENAQWLLSATFNFVLTKPERLRRLLEVCALAARCRAERVIADLDVSATEIARAVQRRIDSSP